MNEAQHLVSVNRRQILARGLRKCEMMAILFLLCGIACVSDEANRYYLNYRLPPKKINEVEVLQREPERPYTVIADFQAKDASVKHMRKRAAEVGADAVIVVPLGGSYSQDEIWAEEDRYSNTYTRLVATAIKYKTE